MNSRKSLEIQLKAEPNTTALAQKFPSINFTSTSRALMSLSKRDRFDGQKIDFMATQISKQLETKREELELLRVTHSTEASLKKNNERQKEPNKVGKTLHFMKKFENEKILPVTTTVSSLTKLPKQKTNWHEKGDKFESPSKMAIK